MKNELPVVVVRNEPSRSKHKIDESFNEMKAEFVPHIKKFVAGHELFRDEREVGITFAQKGVSSIIAILETPNNKLVLKIPRSKTFFAGEGHFLKVWEEAGVSVPHVIEIGELNSYPYTLMEYIDAPTLADAYSKEELLSKGLYAEMGRTLRLMHTPVADGYGFVVDGKAEFETVEELLEGEDMQTRINYVHEHTLIDSLPGYLETALAVITQHAKTEGSTYCHDDFGPNNIFATDPITVFDANPKFNNRYYDLGRVAFADIVSGETCEASEQLLDAYFNGERYDEQVLLAYTFLALCMKFPYWHKTKREKEIETAIRYFIQNKL